MYYAAAGFYVCGLRENHDLSLAARNIAQQFSPAGEVLARIYDCRTGAATRFPTLPANRDFDVRTLTNELRALASEAGFRGASHALLRRWRDGIVIAVVLPRHRDCQKLLIEFMAAQNNGASQFRIETIGAQLFRSLFPWPSHARDIFLSRILRDSLPIVHVSARSSVSCQPTA